MNAVIRPNTARGYANFGWLDSRHTFSFGQFHDPAHMGFGHLRVINEDHVTPGAGFGTHPHRNMEIITYVVDGALAHKDSAGHAGTIVPGDVQLMSAGSGITHSEMNGSQTEPVHFLQIWVLPQQSGTEPRYAQHHFGHNPGLTLVVSPDGRDGSLVVGQDLDLYRALLNEGDQHDLGLRHRRAWIQVVSGELEVNGAGLTAGDGMAMSDVTALALQARSAVNALIFDLR